MGGGTRKYFQVVRGLRDNTPRCNICIVSPATMARQVAFDAKKKSQRARSPEIFATLRGVKACLEIQIGIVTVMSCCFNCPAPWDRCLSRDRRNNEAVSDTGLSIDCDY